MSEVYYEAIEQISAKEDLLDKYRIGVKKTACRKAGESAPVDNTPKTRIAVRTSACRKPGEPLKKETEQPCEKKSGVLFAKISLSARKK